MKSDLFQDVASRRIDFGSTLQGKIEFKKKTKTTLELFFKTKNYYFLM